MEIISIWAVRDSMATVGRPGIVGGLIDFGPPSASLGGLRCRSKQVSAPDSSPVFGLSAARLRAADANHGRTFGTPLRFGG